MTWWNDLWLNDSVATYTADLALQEATEFKEPRLTLCEVDKQWGYWEDQLVTSHPIEVRLAYHEVWQRQTGHSTIDVYDKVAPVCRYRIWNGLFLTDRAKEAKYHERS